MLVYQRVDLWIRGLHIFTHFDSQLDGFLWGDTSHTEPPTADIPGPATQRAAHAACHSAAARGGSAFQVGKCNKWGETRHSSGGSIGYQRRFHTIWKKYEQMMFIGMMIAHSRDSRQTHEVGFNYLISSWSVFKTACWGANNHEISWVLSIDDGHMGSWPPWGAFYRHLIIGLGTHQNYGDIHVYIIYICIMYTEYGDNGIYI